MEKPPLVARATISKLRQLVLSFLVAQVHRLQIFLIHPTQIVYERSKPPHIEIASHPR